MFAVYMKNLYTPILIVINSNDLSFVETSWSNKTLTNSFGNSAVYYFSDIFYYPKKNLIIMPRFPNLGSAVFLNIATNPFSNYTYCGVNGRIFYEIYDSPNDCPLSAYDQNLKALIFDEDANTVSTMRESGFT